MDGAEFEIIIGTEACRACPTARTVRAPIAGAIPNRDFDVVADTTSLAIPSNAGNHNPVAATHVMEGDAFKTWHRFICPVWHRPGLVPGMS